MTEILCPVCQCRLSSGCHLWHFQCNQCGYEQSSLRPLINIDSAHRNIDEAAREAGLKRLRQANFQILLDRISALKPGGGRLLDVGCAHGWFLEVARERFEVLGLEPDEVIFEAALRRRLPVRKGFFPDALEPSERFDVIIFNDVFEHLPDVELVLAACRKHLHENGLLALNLPDSRGIFYRLSKLLCRLGINGPFERLWQKDFPSPHLHYFNANNLTRLLEQNGFAVGLRGSLSTLKLAGLYTRITYGGNYNLLTGIVVYACIVLVYPIVQLLPSDIVFIVSRRT